jgi:hypothetical protein
MRRKLRVSSKLTGLLVIAGGLLGLCVGSVTEASSNQTEALSNQTDEPLDVTPQVAPPTSCAGVRAPPPSPGLPQHPLPLPAEVSTALPALPDHIDRSALVEQVRQAESTAQLVDALAATDAKANADALVRVTFDELTFNLARMRIALHAAGQLDPEGAGARFGAALPHLDILVDRLKGGMFDPGTDIPDESAQVAYDSLRAHLERAVIAAIDVPVNPEGEAILVAALASPYPAVQAQAIAALAAQSGFPHEAEVDAALDDVEDDDTWAWLAQAKLAGAAVP